MEIAPQQFSRMAVALEVIEDPLARVRARACVPEDVATLSLIDGLSQAKEGVTFKLIKDNGETWKILVKLQGFTIAKIAKFGANAKSKGPDRKNLVVHFAPSLEGDGLEIAQRIVEQEAHRLTMFAELVAGLPAPDLNALLIKHHQKHTS